MNILFYYASPVEYNNRLFLGTANLYLKTYIDQNNPSLATKLNWLIPQQRALSDDALIKLCNDSDVDLLCTSHYIWNNQFLLEQLERIAPFLNPKTKIIAGGPSITINIDPHFFESYSFIDYAVYGPGEHAFSNLVDTLVNKSKLYAFNISNIGWYDTKKQQQIVADYQYVTMTQTSPFMHNEEIFSKMITQEQQAGYNVAVPYELTRGCPYSCTFCDWNSGLGNKTTRRKNSYKDDIDLLARLRVSDIYLSDANVGQYDEDIDMVEYFAKKNLENDATFNLLGNYSKLKKENNLKIYHLLATGNLLTQGFTMSCQDIDPTVLENINRPDITWDEHIKIVNELQEHYPNIPSKVQLIQGLPGQTVESWRKTLQEISNQSVMLQIYINELLPTASAARDTDYQSKFKFIYSNSQRFSSRSPADSYFFRAKFAQSCVSFTQFDFVNMTVMSHIYQLLTAARFTFSEYADSFDIERMVDVFLNSSTGIDLRDNLYNNWLDDKFYYTLSFGGAPATISADAAHAVTLQWATDPAFHKFLINEVKNNKFRKEYMLTINQSRIVATVGDWS